VKRPGGSVHGPKVVESEESSLLLSSRPIIIQATDTEAGSTITEFAPPQLSQVAPSLRAVSGRLSPERSALVLMVNRTTSNKTGSFSIETGFGSLWLCKFYDFGGTCLLNICLKEQSKHRLKPALPTNEPRCGSSERVRRRGSASVRGPAKFQISLASSLSLWPNPVREPSGGRSRRTNLSKHQRRVVFQFRF